MLQSSYADRRLVRALLPCLPDGYQHNVANWLLDKLVVQASDLVTWHQAA